MDAKEYFQAVEKRETFPRDDPNAIKEYLIMLMYTAKAGTVKIKAAELLGKMIGAFDQTPTSDESDDEYEFTPLSPDKPEEPPNEDEEPDEED